MSNIFLPYESMETRSDEKFTLHYKLSALLLLAMLSSSFSQAQQFPDFTILVEKASPAVVNISTVRNNTQRFTGNQPQAPNQGQVPEIFKDFLLPSLLSNPRNPSAKACASSPVYRLRLSDQCGWLHSYQRSCG